MNSPGWQVPNTLLEIGGEVTPERMKRLSQSESNTQLWMRLMMEANSDSVKSNILQEPEMSGPCIKANWKWSNEMARVNADTLRISELNGLEWVNLTQMIVISITVGKNPLEEMEQPSQ